MPEAINYEEKTIQLKEAIKALKDDTLTPEEQNRFLKVIVSRIELSTTDKGVKKTDLNLKIFLKI